MPLIKSDTLLSGNLAGEDHGTRADDSHDRHEPEEDVRAHYGLTSPLPPSPR